MRLLYFRHVLTGQRPRFLQTVVGIIAALSLQNCGGEECTGPFCITPPGRQEATKLLAHTGDGQVGAPGRELDLPLEVLVTDDDNQPIPDVEVGFSIVGEAGGTISKPATRSNHQGIAQVEWTLGAGTGVQTVQAVAATSSGTALTGSPVTFSAQAVQPPPSRVLLLQAPPALVQSGRVFDPQPVIGVRNSYDEPVAGADVTVSIASGAGTLQGTNTVVTDAEGRATYDNLAIQGTQGPRTLRFSLSEPVVDIVSQPFEVGAGAATQALGNEPLSYQGVVNSPVSPAPSVIVRDDAGNPVPGVALTFETDRDASVSPRTVITNESGVAQVGSWTLGRFAGVQYSLRARLQSAGISPVVFSATARAGTAGRLEIKVQPSPTAQSGIAFSRQPAIQVTDQLGNPTAESGLAITATLSSGPGGTLQHASATTGASGLATFSDLSLTGLVGDYILSFSEPTLTGVTSNSISIGVGPPSQLALVRAPSIDARSRVPFGTQPSIQLQDGGGNPVAQAGVEVRAAIGSGENALVGQTNILTNGDGRADYTDLAIVGGPGARTLLFVTSSPASQVLSSAITLPPVATISVLTPPPSPVVVAAHLSTPVSWKLTDATNQPVADAPVEISVSTGGSVEPVSASDADGIVQLLSWTVSQAAGTQYVELTVPGVSVSRVGIDVIPDAASRLLKHSGDAQSAPVNDELPEPLVVRVVDQYGNGVSGITVEWRTCDGIGDYNTTSDISGYASAFQPTGAAPGDFCAMASSSGLAESPVHFSYNVTSGTANMTAGIDPAGLSPNAQMLAKPPTAARRNY